MAELKRKLYRRGSSFETTIPMPLLFALDTQKRYNVLFRFEPQQQRWYISFEEVKSEVGKKKRR